MFRRFRVWFCWRVLGRTPMLWEDFSSPRRTLYRRGYYTLDSNGKRGVFIEKGTDQIYV